MTSQASILWTALFAGLTAVAVTGLTRRYALRKGVLDVPNARSSHKQPTPRGGGLGIVAAVVLSVLGLVLAGALSNETAGVFLVGGLAIAGIGFLDDRKPLPAKVRFLVHTVAAAWVVFLTGGVGRWAEVFTPGPWSLILNGFGIFLIVWMINLTNFMDGIDGLAGAEACLSACGAALLFFATGESGLGSLAVALAAASAGFLYWNWPPAKIFMGDGGSGFLGYCFGFFMIAANARVGVCLLILFGVFIVDATYTLLWRFATGQKFLDAHNNHAYQHAARRYTHKPVTVAVCLLNLIWLGPLAALAYLKTEWSPWLVLVAWLPLVVLAARNNAGKPAVQPMLTFSKGS